MIGLTITVALVGLTSVGTIWAVLARRRSTARPSPQQSSVAVTAAASDVTAPDPAAWTSLDDRQLARLLRDSSP
jgi:hypothetical protein